MRHRVMIIDDDKDICALLQMLLSPHYEVITAYDGYSGLRKVQAYEPDLVVVDVKMPKVDGHQLCEAVKHHRDSRHIPVIFITAHSSPEDEFNAFQQGADLYIPKPFDAMDLFTQIQKLLEKAHPREKTLSIEEIQSIE